MWNMFKVNYKNNKIVEVVLVSLLLTLLLTYWTYFTPFSSVFIIDFEQMHFCWEMRLQETLNTNLNIPV